MKKQKNLIYHYLLIGILISNTPSYTIEVDWSDLAWKAGGAIAVFTAVAFRDIVAVPKLTEWRQYYWFETDVEKTKKAQDCASLESTRGNIDQSKSSEVNSDINRVLQAYQLGHIDKETKEKTLKMINEASMKQISETYGSLSNENNTQDQNSLEKDTTTDSKNDAAKTPGAFRKLMSTSMAATIVAINFLAETCGPKKAAEWLGKNSEFFEGKEAIVSGALTITGVVAVLGALYKIYEVYTSDDEEDEDEDFFARFNPRRS